MNKYRIFGAGVFLIIISSSVSAKITKNEANLQVKSIQTTLLKCHKTEKQGSCYFEAEDKYNDLIKIIRAENREIINEKIWLSLNINHANQAEKCRSYDLLHSKPMKYNMYLNCKVNVLNSLTNTAIRLHLR